MYRPICQFIALNFLLATLLSLGLRLSPPSRSSNLQMHGHQLDFTLFWDLLIFKDPFYGFQPIHKSSRWTLPLCFGISIFNIYILCTISVISWLSSASNDLVDGKGFLLPSSDSSSLGVDGDRLTSRWASCCIIACSCCPNIPNLSSIISRCPCRSFSRTPPSRHGRFLYDSTLGKHRSSTNGCRLWY